MEQDEIFFFTIQLLIITSEFPWVRIIHTLLEDYSEVFVKWQYFWEEMNTLLCGIIENYNRT